MAAPIGVDLTVVAAELRESLSRVRYESSEISLTDEMYLFDNRTKAPAEEDFFTLSEKKMNDANHLRSYHKDAPFLARIAIVAIMKQRLGLTGSFSLPRRGHAYVIRQLKRPEEVNLLRRIYGKHFILVSAYGEKTRRKDLIVTKLRSTLSRSTDDAHVSALLRN